MPPDHQALEGQTARAAILAAARSLFSQKGFSGTTTQDIAEQAGVNKRLIFYYFGSKEELYMRTLDDFFGQVKAVLNNFCMLDDKLDDPWLSLLKFSDNFTRFVATHQEPIRILLREIMDEGPFLEVISDTYIKPMFETGFAYLKEMFLTKGMNDEDSLHFLINLTGANLFYFIIAPLLKFVYDTDPVSQENLELRKEQMRRFLMRSV